MAKKDWRQAVYDTNSYVNLIDHKVIVLAWNGPNEWVVDVWTKRGRPIETKKFKTKKQAEAFSILYRRKH